MKLKNKFLYLCVVIIGLGLSTIVSAGNSNEEIQNRLNEQVLAQPFNVQDDAALSKSLEEAKERGTPTKSKVKDTYHPYLYNGYYYPHPYSYYRHYGYWW